MNSLYRPLTAFTRGLTLTTSRGAPQSLRVPPKLLLSLSCTAHHNMHPTGPYSYIRSISNSPISRLRRTYFPQKRPNFGPEHTNGFFYRAKRTINALPSNVILWTILGLNGVVYLLWNVGIYRAESARDFSMLASLHANFTLSWKNWKEGRFWTIITSCFSNQAHSHIFFNALSFYLMAPAVLSVIGNTSFLALYLGGGLASGLVTLFANEFFFHNNRVVHGASGAIYSIISFMACVAPRANFYFFGLVPVPAWGCVLGLFAYDTYYAVAGKETGVSEITHLSGILAGIAYFVRITGRLPRF